MVLQDNGDSSVVTGRDGKPLKFIRNSDTMAVIETKPSCMFRGNLQHAGVNNLEDNEVKFVTGGEKETHNGNTRQE